MATRKTTKRKRLVLNIEQKLEICQLDREKGFSYRRIDKEFGIGRPTEHNILKSEEKLKAFQAQLESSDYMKKSCTMRNSDFPELDRTVFTWFIQERCKDPHVELHRSAIRFRMFGYPVRGLYTSCKLIHGSHN